MQFDRVNISMNTYANPINSQPNHTTINEPKTSASQQGGSGNWHNQPRKNKSGHQKTPDSGPQALKNLLIQFLLAALLVGISVLLLVCTFFVVYRPIQAENDALAQTRLQTRMELNSLISEVLPSMGADDELSEMVLRSLDSQKTKFQKESNQAANDIEQLRQDDRAIGEFLTRISYDDEDFHSVVASPAASDACLKTIGGYVDALDAQLKALGVSELRQEIADLKGTTTTVTREDENGETITETIVTGGLIAEAQAKKDALQKQYDETNGKLTELDAYLAEVDHKITGMYSRLETEERADNVFAKMKAIVEYVKQNPEENIFLADTDEKLASFPGESKEEDDILFMMKIESETGIRMPNVNYGQDYQLVQLSNGMLLCYEAYSIPYYASYQGLKNLIAYFNENDDFYASVYTLTIQYNPQNQSIQGNIIIMHYYLLAEDAEYVPPVLDEIIVPGLDGIFGEVTDNGKPNGPISTHTPEEIESWIKDENLSLVQVRERLTGEGLPETELLWILKKKYKTEDEITLFLKEYGDPTVDYSDRMEIFTYLQTVFPKTDEITLLNIYNAKLPEEDAPADGTIEGETTVVVGKQSEYTFADLQSWLDGGDSLVMARDRLVAGEYPATDLAWIIKEGCTTEQELSDFFLTYGEEGVDYTDTETLKTLFDCDDATLQAIYLSSDSDDSVDEIPDGEITDGETTDGETTDGETTDGETTDGETTDDQTQTQE